MKGENEFVYFLVVGLIVLAVLLAVFSLDTRIGCPSCPVRNRTIGAIEVVKVFDIAQLEASNLIQSTATENMDKYVFSGLLFGEDKIRYDLSKTGLQDVSISFRVNSTNYYGRLIVKVNDKVLEARPFDPGQYEINVPAEFISDHMVIEIAAESSAWRIWAPTVYTLRDVSIAYTSYFSDFSQFKFYLGREYDTMTFSKVDIVLSENVGTFLVDINGRNIWNSPVADEQSIRIEKSDLRIGDNIIKFSAAQDSTFAGRAAIVVIYESLYPEQLNRSSGVVAVQPLTGATSQFYA